MKKTESEKQELLKHFWSKRNPSHDFDNNGVDRFWGTALMVIEEYQEALTLGVVVKPFYCGSDYNHDAGRCKDQCRMCNLEEKKGQQ